MGNSDKPSRKVMPKLLSKAVSIEEVVIDTVVEMTGHTPEEVSEAFSSSDCSNKLFKFSTEYYKNDINIIIADFARECVEKLKWQIL